MFPEPVHDSVCEYINVGFKIPLVCFSYCCYLDALQCGNSPCLSDLWHFYDHVDVFCYLSVLFLWFSLLRLCSANRLGFSASVDRTFFFSLKRPEWDTLTWRPLVADLSTIFSSLALNWLSILSEEMPAWSLFSLLHPCSAGISYKTLGSDFFLREKVSFHQLESAIAPRRLEGWPCRNDNAPLRWLSGFS